MTLLKNCLALGLLAGLAGCLPDTRKNDDSPEPPPSAAEALRKAEAARAAARDQHLKAHHDKCVDLFVKSAGFGGGRMLVLQHGNPNYPKSIDLPVGQEGSIQPWHADKVELVSLLKGDKPGVYPAEGAMGWRRGARSKTRDLDGFEAAALAGLQSGENLRVVEGPDHIRVLGAIRMQADCKRCHDKPDGALLGAFSYVMKPGAPPALPAAKEGPPPAAPRLPTP